MSLNLFWVYESLTHGRELMKMQSSQLVETNVRSSERLPIFAANSGSCEREYFQSTQGAANQNIFSRLWDLRARFFQSIVRSVNEHLLSQPGKLRTSMVSVNSVGKRACLQRALCRPDAFNFAKSRGKSFPPSAVALCRATLNPTERECLILRAPG